MTRRMLISAKAFYIAAYLADKLCTVLSPRWRTLVAPALLTCILLYAALLRLDALFKSYGPYDSRDGWRRCSLPSERRRRRSRPTGHGAATHTPYVGGDPINYLKFAREMRNFYAAHVREPMFPAVTRIGLMFTGDADVGISVTSIVFGLLTLVATYALGALVASPMVGLAAAAMLAIDHSAVYWAIGGWRDELFAFFAISCAWAWLRFARHPTRANAVLAGALSGGACLTRITTIALIAPAVIWLLDGDAGRRRRYSTRRGALAQSLAVGIMAIVVAPFLINCAIATGDPFYAINNHTDFYLKREGVPDVRPISAVAYSLDKFESRPIAATDNAVRGVFVYPFTNKWVGLDRWYPGPWNGAGVSRDRRPRRVAVVRRRPPSPRHVLRIARPVQHDVDGARRRRMATHVVRLCVLPHRGILGCGQDRAICAVSARARDEAPWAQVDSPSDPRPAAIVLALVLVAGAWGIAVPYAVAREALTTRRRHHRGGTSRSVVLRRRLVRPRRRGKCHNAVCRQRRRRRSESCCPRRDRTRSPCASIRSIPLRRRRRSCRCRSTDSSRRSRARAGIRNASGNIKSRYLPASFTPGDQRLELRSDAAFKLWYVRIAAL